MAIAPLTAPGTAGLEGHYAGIVSRSGAFVLDLAFIAVLFSLGGVVLEYVLTIVMRHPMQLGDAVLASNIALVVWAFVYFAYPQSVSGRTLGMAMVGLRAVRADGSDLKARNAVAADVVPPAQLPAVRARLRADRPAR